MKKFLFCLAALTFVLAACSGGDDDPVSPTPTNPKQEETPALTVDSSITTNGISFTEEAGDKSMTFTATEPWTLTIAATTRNVSWCTASQTSGNAGTFDIKFTVTANDTYDDRSVAVTLKAGTVTKSFRITQKAVDALLLTTDTYELDQEGGTIEVEVKANIDYQMEISPSAKEWITQASTRSLTARTYTLNVAKSEEYEKRQGEIYFKSGDKVETVTVYQTGGPVLLLTKNDYAVSDEGERITVELSSNFDFAVKMPQVDWISESTATRGMSSHTLYYDIAPNTTYDSRTAEIVYYDKNGSASDTLKITQAQKGAIILSKKKYEVSSLGETIEVEYNSSVDCVIEIPSDCSWITQTEANTRGLSLRKAYFKIAPNDSKEVRKGEIIICDANSQLADTLVIEQEGFDYYLRLTRTEDNITWICNYRGGEFGIDVESNGPFEVEFFADDTSWIHYRRTEDRGNNTYCVFYYFDQNDTDEERTVKFRYSLGPIVHEFYFAVAEKRELNFSQTEFNVTSEGGRFPLTVSTDGKWALSVTPFYVYKVPSEASSWLSVENDLRTDIPDVHEGTANIIVQPNLTNQPRSASIWFQAFSGEEEYYIKISQTAQGAVILSRSNYILSNDTHTLTIEMATSDYAVEIDNAASSWISLGSKTGTGDQTKQEIVISQNTTGKERNGAITFSTADAKNQVTVTQLMTPPVLEDDTPEKWKQFQLPTVRLTFSNPDSEGSQIYKAIVPDCEELVNIASRKVLNCLYDDPTSSIIPRQKELEYALEDFDGISYNVNSGQQIVLSNQYLAQYYKTYGAEAMIKENIGILTHELTHSYQLQPQGCGDYQEGTHFWVFIEGVADAVRTLNGGFPNDSDRPRGGSYMSGYRYTGFFLVWLVNNKDKDFLRKFNRSANEINPWSFDAGIKYALGEQYSADELWTEYQKAMGDM